MVERIVVSKGKLCGLYSLSSECAPRYVGVDVSTNSDWTCECEFEITEDGVRILDGRQYKDENESETL